MKKFIVYLTEGRVAEVYADAWAYENHRFVFKTKDKAPEQFFNGPSVIGITDAKPAPQEARP